MKKEVWHSVAILFIVTIIVCPWVGADGGYVSRSEAVAISADQRAIIIKNGNEISMTFSTGYTGEGGDFGWIIPTPVPPAIEDVSEARETAFRLLDEYTAPEIYSSSGCFPPGTKVLTKSGPRAIETVRPGTEVYACDLPSGEWIFTKVSKQGVYRYAGDMITIQMDSIIIEVTGNHPFYVLRGNHLAVRPVPKEIPKEEQGQIGLGRWVEARDLGVGDVLKAKSGEQLTITSLSSRYEMTDVHHLEVERYHNYAVHQAGILVHNGGGKEESTAAGAAPLRPVTIYGSVTLEHYEVSILGAANASALLNWLQNNDYHVNPTARDVLDAYIAESWAFVAVKLNPSEKRHYDNEFLPPVTIKYQYDQLIFPLRISSVSTRQAARITLFVISESTVTSSNFPTAALKFEQYLPRGMDPESYVEGCIQKTMASEGGGLVLMWSGEFVRQANRQETLDGLMQNPFREGTKSYLTRLETRMDPVAMTEDIKFVPEPRPKEFLVMLAGEGYDASVDLQGITLVAAAKTGEIEAVRKLLAAGANVEARDKRGYTALMYAVARDYVEIMRVLLNAGADVNATDSGGKTALLHGMSGMCRVEIVQMLIDAGADVNARDNDWSNSALHICTYDAEIVQTLLDSGADVNARNRNDETPLMCTIMAIGPSEEVIEVLLNAGADVNVINSGQKTALDIARSKNRTGIIQLLKKTASDEVRQ